MTTLASACNAIQIAAGGVSGIKYAPEQPPETPEDFPFVVTYPETFTGTINTMEDFRMLYNITVELHISRQDLPVDVARLLAYAESFPNVIFKALKTNAIAASGITGTFGALEWGGIETIGYRWTVQNVKVITNIT
ncbi:MAG: hypothetical protein M0R06_17210 [Sphaerochaeta sp.]|jgi:hypothetical protein|nr:hypothetical protein [Sphaerochaeta sp.]